MNITIEGSSNDIVLIASVWAVYTAKDSDDCSDAIGPALDFMRLLISQMHGLYRDQDGDGDNFLLTPMSGLSEHQQRIARLLLELDFDNA